MQFMVIFTYEPDKRNEVVQRRVETSGALPEGMKLLDEWSVIGGGKVFRVIEADDPKIALMASFGWSDLGNIEIIPVINTEEAMKLIGG